ncbi:TetR/AcrR family transcriptional regulator [Nakamurella alba]|uniref:TetR/AcrR family transcriptional regulator n=1 Tax=Nakamurella alba TaxID=2665158 RepID=UPI002AC3526B|nr:TetR family transcriptional regulator [Nakamurella alba]
MRALQAAVDLADEEGVDAVSMRRLAARLGVVPMALYKHVVNKDDLLGGMVDTVIGEYAAPGVGADWKAAVRDRVLSARKAVARHPWARSVIESRSTRTAAVLGHLDAVSGAFLGGGLSPDLTHHAMHALGHRVWGFSPEAFDDSADPGALRLPADPDEQQQLVDRMRSTYPHITAIALDSGGACDADFEFEWALDLLLDAVGRLHEAGWVSPRRR